MSEATVTTLPTPAAGHVCDECGKVCASANGVLIHQARAHGDRSAKTQNPARSKPPTQAAVAPRPKVTAVPDIEVLAVLADTYHELCGADVGVAITSAAALMAAIDDAGWRVVAQ